MDYLADGLGILGFALLLAKFIVARHDRKRIFGHSDGTRFGPRVQPFNLQVAAGKTRNLKIEF
jgi:hypothetical protein